MNVLGSPVVPHSQASRLINPTDRLLHHPARLARAAAVPHATSGDQDPRLSSRAAGFATDRWAIINGRKRFGHAVGSASETVAAGVDKERVSSASIGPVRWIRLGPFARKIRPEQSGCRPQRGACRAGRWPETLTVCRLAVQTGRSSTKRRCIPSRECPGHSPSRRADPRRAGRLEFHQGCRRSGSDGQSALFRGGRADTDAATTMVRRSTQSPFGSTNYSALHVRKWKPTGILTPPKGLTTAYCCIT
jgi:hypothetical protein